MTSDSSPCPTVTASQWRSSPVAAATVRARSPRPLGRSTTASRRWSPGRSALPPSRASGLLLHIVARGKIGRSPEADLLQRYLKRISWPTKVTELPDKGGNVPALPPNSVSIVLDERGQPLS